MTERISQVFFFLFFFKVITFCSENDKNHWYFTQTYLVENTGNEEFADLDVLVRIDPKNLILPTAETSSHACHFRIQDEKNDYLPSFIENENGCKTDEQDFRIWIRIPEIKSKSNFFFNITFWDFNYPWPYTSSETESWKQEYFDDETKFSFYFSNGNNCELNGDELTKDGLYLLGEDDDNVEFVDDEVLGEEYHFHEFNSFNTDGSGIISVAQNSCGNDGITSYGYCGSHSHVIKNGRTGKVASIYSKNTELYTCKSSFSSLDFNLNSRYYLLDLDDNDWKDNNKWDLYDNDLDSNEIYLLRNKDNKYHEPTTHNIVVSSEIYYYQDSEQLKKIKPVTTGGKTVAHNHYHNFTVNFLDSGVLPPYQTVALGKFKKEDEINSFYDRNNVIFMSSFIPIGFQTVEKLKGRFPALKKVYQYDFQEESGGSKTHKHKINSITKITNQDFNVELNYDYDFSCYVGDSINFLELNHNHVASVINVETNEASSYPYPYQKIFYIKRKEQILNAKLINQINNTIESDRGGSDNETFSFLMVGLIVFIPIVIILAALIFFGFVICLIRSRKIKGSNNEKTGSCTSSQEKKTPAVDEIDLLLQEEEKKKTAKLNINSKLFEINFDDIKIIKSIGSGGSNAIILLGEYQDTEVAFKCFKIADFLGENENLFSEFEKEVEILSSVSHPSILRFYGASLKSPRVGIVMEYAKNGDCKQFLSNYLKENGKIYPLKERIRILNEIGKGMKYLHKKNIIHRDLKPENVLIDKNEESKIMDFGLSRIIDSNISISKTRRVGTSLYMAPEVTRGTHYSPKCDVFSFGIMIFTIMTGKWNCYGSNISFNLELVVAQKPEYRPNLKKEEENEYFGKENQWLIDLMKKCWDDDPSNRPSFIEVVGVFKKMT